MVSLIKIKNHSIKIEILKGNQEKNIGILRGVIQVKFFINVYDVYY